jgi:tetratricopeptide (TPR) repeat protein
MVYLIRKKDSEHKQEVSNFASASPTIQATEAIITQAPSSQNNSKTPVSEEESTGSLGNSLTDKIKKLISTTQQHQQDGNLEQGILDLREALKLDPNNSTCHALIGSLYLQQGNTTYARVHLKKATELNSNDPMVKQASKDLKEWEAKQKSTSGQKEKSSVAKGQKASKGKKAKGKKEPPKIFGIPLW